MFSSLFRILFSLKSLFSPCVILSVLYLMFYLKYITDGSDYSYFKAHWELSACGQGLLAIVSSVQRSGHCFGEHPISMYLVASYCKLVRFPRKICQSFPPILKSFTQRGKNRLRSGRKVLVFNIISLCKLSLNPLFQVVVSAFGLLQICSLIQRPKDNLFQG